MKNTLGVTGAAVLFSFVIAMTASTALHAKKLPKVDICHFSADSGEYKLKNVSMNAQKAHLRHGDGLPGEDNPAIGIVFDEACTPIVGPAILAHAFIEMGVIDRVYDPVTDFTIALLEDTNSDGVASAGDMVRMGNYPLIFNPTINDLGTFQVESHVVLSADTILAKIGVDVTGARMEWSNNGSNLESFTDRDSLSPNFFRIRDIQVETVLDSIEVFGSAASNPDTIVFISNSSPSDDSFLQVVIN